MHCDGLLLQAFQAVFTSGRHTTAKAMGNSGADVPLDLQVSRSKLGGMCWVRCISKSVAKTMQVLMPFPP